jgi:hypothetical protein
MINGYKSSKEIFTRSTSKDRRRIENKDLLKINKQCTINKEILSNENLLKDKQSLNIQTPNPLGSQRIYNRLTIVID